ncbi:putative phage tail protein [uncultured Acetatifactor sp.]|uniref:putative phage tail protein n=1 Tax=uncultured Acetatifactor sp. TaxID=1671927 RepID=UPI00262C6F27|nr:putative phage tail protein [uncultured Acetatifactor sp.]
MLVFNNQQRSGYEEIASYSPRYYRSIKEMDAVFRLAGWLIDLMAQDMEDMVAYQFLKYMNDEALTRYEAFLHIVMDENKSIDERKAYISALLIGSGKLSADKIVEMVNKFRGCDCEGVTLEGSTLHISIIMDEDFNQGIDIIHGLIKRKVPAHITTDIVYYNALSGKTYFGNIMGEADIMELTQR